MELFSYLGGIVSVLNLLWFAWRIWAGKIKPQNIASWLMWTCIDVVILACTIAAHQPISLPLSYTVGAASVTGTLWVRGTWNWSRDETICAIGAGLSLLVWQMWSASFGILFGCIALTVAGRPIFLEMLQKPIRGTWPVWILTVIAGVFTLLGSDWSFSGTILAWGGIIFNGTLAYLVLRPRRITIES